MGKLVRYHLKVFSQDSSLVSAQAQKYLADLKAAQQTHFRAQLFL